MISIEAHRAAIGRYYSQAKHLTNPSDNIMNICCCKKYEDAILKLSGYNYLTMHRCFYSELINTHEYLKFTEKDLEFCVVMIETVFNVSFLKVLQLLVDGDIESNPGTTDNIENTPTRGKGRPTGTPKKAKGFRGTPKKIITNSSTIYDNIENINGPIGLVNVAHDCFFNSVVQALFSLETFRNHVRNFDSQIPDEVDAVCSIKQLFRDIEAKSNNRLHTHENLTLLGLPGHEENTQFDAQECMTYILNLFYPQINDTSNPRHNQLPENCEFLLEGEESIICFNCNKHSNKNFGESLSQIAFPEFDVQSSVQLKIDEMTNNPYGEILDELFKCEHCRLTHPNGTEATRNRTLMNINKYIIIQLKTFAYNQMTQQIFKTTPNLQIEEQIHNELLGKLNLCAVVYHIGDTPTEGHYMCCVKKNNIWYTCNDEQIFMNGVKLHCAPTDQDNKIPYLLIYEKENALELMPSNDVSHRSEDDPIVIADNDDFVDFRTHTNYSKSESILNCESTSDNIHNRTRMNLLKELDIQKIRIAKAYEIEKERASLLNDISSAKKKILESKKEKRKLQACLKKLSFDDSNQPKIQKLSEKIDVFDEEILVAKKELESKSSSLNCPTTKSPIKRKKTFSDYNSTKRVQSHRDKLDEDTKGKIQADNTQKHKTRRENLDEETKAKIQADNTEKHKTCREKLDEETKAKIQDKNTKYQKSKRSNLDEDTKGKIQADNTQKHKTRRENLDEETKAKIQADNTQKHKTRRENLDEETKAKIQADDTEKHKNRREKLDNDAKAEIQDKNTKYQKGKRTNAKMIKDTAFKAVQGMSMVDPSIFNTEAYAILSEEVFNAFKQGPEYECTICFKLEFKRTVIRKDPTRYDKDIFKKCCQDKSEWICKSCDRYMKKKKIPPQSQVNNMYLCPRIEELECLSYLECMLISQIIPFMSIISKQKSSQNGIKGQCVLVPTDLKKIQNVLPRTCNEENIVSIALKRRLSDSHAYHQQNINATNVNAALDKLIEINPFYRNVRIDKTWETVSRETDPETWNLLTNPDAEPMSDETDSDEEMANNSREISKTTTTNVFPTALHNKDGPDINACEILNIAPGEGQIPLDRRTEPNCEALAFPKEFATGKFHYNYPRDIKLTPIQYAQSRLKCSDNRFASNAQYLFSTLDWVEKSAVASTVNFTMRKQFQSDINVGQALDSSFVQRMIGEDQIYASFKNIRGTPQYFHNMMLDILAKIRQFGPPAFFITCSAAEMGAWIEIIQTIARQFGTTLSDNDVKNLSWKEKINWIKRNPVTAARMIDDRFRQLFGRILYSGMHPVGQLIDHNERREFQNRGAQHPHGILHVEGAPVFDKDSDEKVVTFIDKYITCAIPDKKQYPELHKLVTTVQTHGHSQTCKKKKGVKCRFNFPAPPSETTRIVRLTNCDSNNLTKEKRKVVDTVLENIMNRNDLTGVPLTQILSECDISEEEYYDALDYVSNKVTVQYKRKPSEQNVSPYNTVILSLMKSNMNLQYVTGMYGVIKYLTSYMCKPERTMSELMKKASKEATNKGVQDKLWAIGNVFTTKREVSTDEAIVRALSLPMRSSKINVDFIVTGLKENRTRALKSPEVLQKMNSDDPNVYTLNILDKYANRPDKPIRMDYMCLADFATNYVHEKAYEPETDTDDIRQYTTDVSSFDIEIDESKPKSEIITLKNEMGKMRKRTRPCVMRYHKVSKMKDTEMYYLILLQLYLPWRDQSDLKGQFSSYQEMFAFVEDNIKPNILKHEPYFEQVDLDLDDMMANMMDDDDPNNEGPDRTDFNFLNPDLLDIDARNIDRDDTNFTPATASINNRSMSREENYEICSHLNEGQLEIFNYVMRYAVEYMLNERNDKPLPDPIYVFLSGAGGVGKSYVTKAMIENTKNVLKFHLQDFDNQPSVAVTASTGKAACDLNGTTLHSAFSIPLKGRKQLQEGPTLNSKRKEHCFLNMLFTDEISMTGLFVFDSLNTILQKIKGDKRDFGGVSIIAIGDLFQLPPVKMFCIYSMINQRINDPWLKFKLHELTEIVRQSGDPVFAALLLRLREGKQTADDIIEIKKLKDTDTSTWPEEVTHLYMTNFLANNWNEECLSRLESEDNQIVTVVAKDLGPKNTTIPIDIPISNTGNMKKSLRVCEGAKVMITKNLDIGAKLINGTLGTIKKLDRVNGDNYGYPTGRIYIKCDDESAGNVYKDCRLIQELKECVPINPSVGDFKYNGKQITRNQFPFILAHGITTHKSQGSTLEYFVANLDRSSAKGTKKVNITEGMFYTMLSRGKDRKNIKLNNFDEECIKVNKAAVTEMERLRNSSVLDYPHPLKKMNTATISYLNIVKWSKHISHFLSDTAHSLYSSLLCFTETNIAGGKYDRIKSYLPEWDDIHKPEGHGLAICYNTTKVRVLKQFPYVGVLEILPVLLQIDVEIIFLVLVYRPPGPIGTFVTNIIHTMDQIMSENPITEEYRTMVIGDFNWDQMLPGHVESLFPFSTHFNLFQRSNYSTHIKGGILDLVFDDKRDNDVQWMFSPFSDHFVLLIDL